MNAPIRLTVLPLDVLQHAIAHPDPDLWLSLTPADLHDLRQRCKRHWTVWWMQLHPLRLFALIAAVLAVPGLFVVVAIGEDFSRMGAWGIFFACVAFGSAILTGLLMLAMTACFVAFKLDRLAAVSDRLKAVPHAEYYSKFSLDTLAHSEGAQRYYAEVKARGRELCVLDFEVMLKLAAADRLNAGC